MGHVQATRVHSPCGSGRVSRAPAPEGVSADNHRGARVRDPLLGTSPGVAAGRRRRRRGPLMDRRRVLLVVAAIIAALGTLLVFLYVRGADDRAQEKFHAVKVLKAVKQINVGE